MVSRERRCDALRTLRELYPIFRHVTFCVLPNLSSLEQATTNLHHTLRCHQVLKRDAILGFRFGALLEAHVQCKAAGEPWAEHLSGKQLDWPTLTLFKGGRTTKTTWHVCAILARL